MFGAVWHVIMFKNLKYYFNMMKKNRKQDIVAIILALILVSIVFAITIIIVAPPPTPKNPIPTVIIPTPIPTQPIPQIIYNSPDGAKLANKIIHRVTLSTPDSAAKTTTLTTILKGDNSGVIYKNSDVSVEYVKSMDLFMADILTPNINEAKLETVTWFENQGFSQQAVCNLPIMFYLDSSVSYQLQKTVQFSPLANGC